MENGQVGSTQEVLENFILKFKNYAFHINLMQMIIESFDVIIGMDWLSSHHINILCYEKAVHLPLPNG